MAGQGWQQQLYAAERQYSDFFPDLELPTEQSDHENLSQRRVPSVIDMDTSELFDEDAFNSTVSSLGIVALDREGLIPVECDENKLDSTRRYSRASINQMELIDDLEKKFETLVTEIERMKTDLLIPKFFGQETLDRYKGDLAQLGGNLDTLQFTEVDAIPTTPVRSGKDPVTRRRKSLNRRCLLLKDEFDDTVELLTAIQRLQDKERAHRADQGLLYDEEGALIRLCDYDDVDDGYHESMRIPLLDQLDPDWGEMIDLQKRLAMSPLARRYVLAMESNNLPLCDAVYEYLQDPSGHAYTLALCNMQLQEGELDVLLNFLTSSRKLRTELLKLVLYNCILDDQDCQSLSQALPNFSDLVMLSLKENRISSAGVGDIMRSLVNCNGLKIESLQLDGNLIEAVGVVEIVIALPFCPLISSLSLSRNPIGDLGVYFLMRGLMNKKRKAIRSLSIPPGDEDCALEIIRDYDLEFNAEDEAVISVSTPADASFSTSSAYFLPYTSRRQSTVLSQDIVVTGDGNGVMETKENSVDSSSNVIIDQSDELRSCNTDRVLPTGEAELNNNDKEESMISKSSGTSQQNMWYRLRLKLMAVSAFQALKHRGHNLYCLKMEQCNLSPVSAVMIAHMLKDNYHLTDIILDHNKNLLTAPSATKAFADLLAASGNRIRVLSLRDTGIDDKSAQQICMGIKHKNSQYLNEIDLSDGNMGSVGAAWLAGCTRNMFFDQLSVSSVPSKSYAIDLL